MVLLIAILLPTVSVKAAGTLKIGGESAIGNTELLSQYGMTLGSKTVGQNQYPLLTLNNSVVSVEDIGIEYTYSKGSSASSPNAFHIVMVPT